MKPRPLPAHLRTEPFLVSEALPLVGAERLRRTDLVSPARGIRLANIGADPRLTPHTLSRLLGADQYFSHLTAARLWGTPLPGHTELHTTTIGTGTVTRRPGVVGHRISRDRADVDMVDGLPVSAPAAAWVECATLLDLDELVVVGDYLVGRVGPLTLDDLAAAVRRRAGSRRIRLLREALALVRVGSESPRETRLRLLIVRAGLPEPVLNENVLDAAGRFVGRPDLAYPVERVCVEFDGDHHRTDRRTFRNDIRRRERFVAAGWHALHVSDDDLTTYADEFLTHLTDALRLRR